MPKWLKIALMGVVGAQVAYWGLKLASPYLSSDDYHQMMGVFLTVALVALMVAMFGGKGSAG